jgi:hypothetical protein
MNEQRDRERCGLPGCSCVGNPLNATLLRRHFWPTAPKQGLRHKPHQVRKLGRPTWSKSKSGNRNSENGTKHGAVLRLMRWKILILLRAGVRSEPVRLAASAASRVLSVLVDRGWCTRRAESGCGWSRCRTNGA